jgi:hypothetical protein
MGVKPFAVGFSSLPELLVDEILRWSSCRKTTLSVMAGQTLIALAKKRSRMPMLTSFVE